MQQKLKREAAERRQQAADRAVDTPRPRGSRRRG
jgi:hypothetical protein